MSANDLPFINDLVKRLQERESRKPYFVMIGAMDGIRYDLLAPSIHKHQLPGLFIEPIVEMMYWLKKNYANHVAELKFETSAITNRDGWTYIHRIPLSIIRSGEVPEICDGMSSLYLNKNEISDYSDYIVKEIVEEKRLATVLTKHNITKIDILQIDAEGCDFDIFMQLDFEKYKPYWIHIEVHHLEKWQTEIMGTKLFGLGYEIFQSGREEDGKYHVWNWICRKTLAEET